MRKKFLAMYALVGALVASPIFTSCIDEGEESASVTAARDAKSAQIKATAEYEKQMNELNLALKQLQLEAEQANAEKVKHEVEAAIAKAKEQTVEYTYQMYNYQDLILTELTGNYTGALNNIASYNQSLLNEKTKLAQLEADLISAQAYTKQKTLEINNDIAAKKAAIELLKNTEANDKDALSAQLKELEVKRDATDEAYKLLDVQYGDTDIRGWYWPTYPWSDYGYSNETNLATIEAARKLHELAAHQNWDETSGQSTNPYDANNNNPWYFIQEDANGYWILKEADVVKYKQSNDYKTPEELAKDIEDMKAALGTDKDTETTTISEDDPTLTLYAQLAAANKQLEADKKALADAEKALADNTDASQTATLEGAVNTAKEAINGDGGANEGSEMAAAKAKDAINDQLYAIAHAETISDFDEWIAAFSGEDYEAYKAAVNELDAAFEAKNLAYDEYTEIELLVTSSKDRFSAEYIAETLAEYETALAELEADLKKINYIVDIYNDTYNGSVEYREAAIAIAKEYIAYYEAQIAAAEVRAEQAKAAMDAYLGTSDDDATTEEAA